MRGSSRESIGPLIYIIFMNKLPLVASQEKRRSGHNTMFPPGCESCGQTVIYAEDMSHLFREKNNDDMLTHLYKLMGELESFFMLKRLVVNANKTHWIKGRMRKLGQAVHHSRQENYPSQ